jgi:hypothetical protein
MDKIFKVILEWFSVLSALAAALITKLPGGDKTSWQLPLLAFSITTLVIRWLKHEKELKASLDALAASTQANQTEITTLQTYVARLETESGRRYKEWSEHRTTEEAAIAAIASEVENGKDLEERLLLRVLQSLTFRGSDIDKIFWVRYAEPLLDEFRNDRWGILEKATSIRKTGRVVDDKNRYRVMDILMGRLVELADEQQPKHRPIYRGVAYEEELKEMEAQSFIFELPQQYASKGIEIQRLFVVQSQTSFPALLQTQKEMLRRQKKAGVLLRWISPNPEKPQNYGIYGQVAIGEMVNGSNGINFERQAVENRIRDWKRFWENAKDVTDEMLA